MAHIQKLERKKGIVYRIRVGNGYDVNGKQKMKSMNWVVPEGLTPKQEEKELNKIAVDFERQVINGTVFENVKFEEFSRKWLEDYAKKKCSPKFVFESERILKEINKEIGHIPLPKLRKAHLQEFYNKLSNEVKITKKKTKNEEGKEIIETIERRKSPATILKYHRLISTILTKATQWDYISNNICLGKGVEIPAQAKSQPDYLQDSDVLKLVELLQDAPLEYKTIILLLLYTGMRNGEAMGLEWKDIDFENNIISINKSSQYLPGIGVFTKEPKNNTSVRTIQVVPELIDLLKQYKIWQSEQRLKVGPIWKANPENTDEKHCDNWNNCKKKDNKKSVYCDKVGTCKQYKDIDRLFTQYNGIPMHPDTPSKWLKKFIKRSGLPDFHIHSLRHTNISLMIMQGVPLPSVAKLAGHSSTATTTRIYSHSIQSAEQLAIEKVANVINPNRKAK